MNWRRARACDHLRTVPVFSHLSDRELAQVDSLLTRVKVPAGRVLMTEGQPGQECFVIAEGNVGVSREGIALGAAGPGELVGEMALLDGGPRKATATTLTDVVAYALTPSEFATLLHYLPSVQHEVLQLVTSRLRRALTASVASAA